MSEDELVANLVLLFVAGHETTTNWLGNGLLALLRHPDQVIRLRQKPELMATAVEELLRYDSPANINARVNHQEIEMGGQTIPTGSLIFCMLGAANRGSAAFFALGIAKASRRPVLLLATSGTAPANWLPAIIVASQAGVPLVAISADRPPELQGCGANQTIDQRALFGTHIRASHLLGTPDAGFDPAFLQHLAARSCEQACWPHPGPVHINQPFREPLLPATAKPSPCSPATILVSPPDVLPHEDDIRTLAQAIAGRPGIIVCGELVMETGLAEALTALAARLGCPILAESLSN